MGLFDNFLKQIDDGLKAVESGALEERLGKFADAVEQKTQQAESTLQKAADKPKQVLGQVEAQAAKVTKIADELPKSE